MTKKTAEQNDTQAVGVVVAAVASATKRQPRVITTATVPSKENDFTGSVDISVIGSDRTFNFAYKTPELEEVQARAMRTGFVTRLSSVIGGLSDVAKIEEVLAKEVANLSLGLFPIRSGSSGEQEFTDTIIALAIIEKTQDKSLFLTTYEDLTGDITKVDLLASMKKYNELDEDGKKEVVSSDIFKAAKKAVAYAKVM